MRSTSSASSEKRALTSDSGITVMTQILVCKARQRRVFPRDADMVMWQQYAAKAWPTLAVLDPTGLPRRVDGR